MRVARRRADAGRRAACSCRPRAFSPTPPSLRAATAPTGVLWPNNRNVAELAPYLDKLALVALVFPTFKDGRAYSQARLLRERYGFRGELRATGDVLRDQFLFLVRAGFDAFEVKKDADAAAFAASLARYSVFYQPAADGRVVRVPAAARGPARRSSGARRGRFIGIDEDCRYRVGALLGLAPTSGKLHSTIHRTSR